MYVTTDEDLPELIQKLENCEVLAVDTEFVREKTYFHRLGLIQIGGDGVYGAVDPQQQVRGHQVHEEEI